MTRRLCLLLLLGACSAPPPPTGGDGGEEPPDGGTDAGRTDAGLRLPGCSEDNAAASVAARDGFFERCVDAGAFPWAQCGDGSPLKLSWRDSPDGGTGLFLYFRGAGRCADYVGCWGRDGKGGEGRTVAGLSNTERVAPRVSFAQVAHGLFNGSEPGNALAGFSAVHVPDCTGDLGARDEVVDFARPMAANLTAPASLRTYFRGARDVEAAVALARERYPSPSRVVLGGSGEGAYFALAALPGVDAAWPGVPLTVLFDGEAGVGDAALEAKFRAALQGYDGQGGRRLARFVALSFVSDPLQRAAAPAGYTSAGAFQAALQAALEARQAAAPATFRFFTPFPACHAVAMTPGLWSQYVPWTGGLRPAQPTQRPNPDLAALLSPDGGADGGAVWSAPLEPWLFEALSTTGAYDGGFSSVGRNPGATATACTLPDSLDP